MLHEFDLHIHTRRYSSCSIMDPLDAVKAARDAGLAGMALTEHGIRWKDEDVQELREQCGCPDIVIIPGEEAACYSRRGEFQGEFLVYGYPESLGSSKDVRDLIGLVHDAGGVVVAAHPFKPADTKSGFYGSGHATLELDLDGLEVFHPDYNEKSRELALDAVKRMNVCGLANSDAHDVNSVGRFRTRFREDVTDTASLCRAIREQDCLAVAGIMVYENEYQ